MFGSVKRVPSGANTGNEYRPTVEGPARPVCAGWPGVKFSFGTPEKVVGSAGLYVIYFHHSLLAAGANDGPLNDGCVPTSDGILRGARDGTSGMEPVTPNCLSHQFMSFVGL